MAALTFVSRNEDQADTNSYSIASQASGTAGTRRWVAVWGRKNSAGNGLPATCSIGGEALTPVADTEIVGNVGADNTSFGARWFTGIVSVGGNQTIAFTFTSDGGGGAAATMIRAGFALYEDDGGFSATPNDTLVDQATANNDRELTGTVAVADGGAVVGFGVISGSANITCTLTGLATEDFDIQEGSANNNLCAGHENGLSTEANRTITFTWAAGGNTDDACISVISLAPSAGIHNLTADSLASGTPTLDTPTLAQIHALTADSLVVGAPVLGSPVLATVHALTADALAVGVPALGSPGLAQTHALAADSLASGAPQLGAPGLGIIGAPAGFPLSIGPSFPVGPDREARVNEADYVDGYSDRSADGLNHIRTTWNLRWDMLTHAQAENADTFLQGLGGYQSFLWTPPGQPEQRFRCKTWKPTKITGNTSTFTAVFEQANDIGA